MTPIAYLAGLETVREAAEDEHEAEARLEAISALQSRTNDTAPPSPSENRDSRPRLQAGVHFLAGIPVRYDADRLFGRP